jgi:hypothetical protein
MAEPLTSDEAKARFRETVAVELGDLPPESTWEWILLSLVTGLVAGHVTEGVPENTRRSLAPLMALLGLVERSQCPAPRPSPEARDPLA